MSDNYRSYWRLGELGWNHQMVNHSLEFVEEHDREVHTETIEGICEHIWKDSAKFPLNFPTIYFYKQVYGVMLKDG